MSVIETVKGLIIKQNDYGESNRMLTIFTDQYGIIKAAAHGAKSIRSRQSAASQFLSYSEFTFRSGNSDILTVTSAHTIDSFFPIHEDIEKLSVATYFADLTYACLDLQNPDIELLRLFLNTLYAMAYKNIDAQTAKAVFEMRAICISGFEPLLGCCSVCGTNENIVGFSLENGGAVCKKCMRGNDLYMPPASCKMLEYVTRSRLEKLFSFKADTSIIEKTSYISERYAAYQMEREFESLKYYKSIITKKPINTQKEIHNDKT